MSELLGTALPASSEEDIEAELAELFGEEALKVMDAMPAVPTSPLPVATPATTTRPAAVVTAAPAPAARQRVAVPA